MRPIKILFKILITLIFIVGIAVAGVVFLVDPNDYKDDIIQQVKTKTGRDLRIPGDIAFSVYPWFGLKLGEVSLSNPETFARPDFAQMQALDIRISLKRLLNLQPEIGVMHIDGLDVTLIKRSDGVSNWDDLISEQEQPVAEEPVSSTPRSDANSIIKSLVVSSFEIRNASIQWLDETTKTNIALSDLNLRTGIIRLASPTSFDISFDTQLSEPDIDAKVISSGKLSTLSDFSSVTLNNWSLSLNVSGAEIPNQQQIVNLSGNVIYDLSEQVLNLIDITVDVADLSALVDVNVSQLDTAPVVKGKLIVSEFSLAKTLQSLAVEMPEMADKSALNRVSMLADIDAADNELILSNVAITLDDSELKGDARVEVGKTIKASYNLNLDEIDLDKYLPPVEEAPLEADNSSKQDVPLDLPVDLIRQLTVTGEFTAKAIKAFNVRMRDITAKNVIRDDIAQVKLDVKKMYSGSGDVLLSIDARGQQPAVSMKSEFANIKVGNLLNDYMDSEFLTGNGSLRFDVKALAQTSDQLTSTLKGAVAFDLLDGEITGINIAEKLRQAEALKDGLQYKKSREVNATDFASLSGKGNITGGKFSLSAFKLSAPLLRADAKGSVDIHNETFNMKFDAYFVNTKTGQAGKQLNDVRSIRVPIKLRGTFDDPDLGLDGSRVVKEKKQAKVNEAKSKLEQKKVEVKEKAKKEFNDSKQEALKNLFDKLR